jgi:hypothetical protein
VGSDIPLDSELIIEELDKELSLLNDDYAYVRKYNLGKPILTVVPIDTFYGFLESLGKLGAQNKMPRVLNKEQTVKWTQYINANDFR